MCRILIGTVDLFIVDIILIDGFACQACRSGQERGGLVKGVMRPLC